MNRYVLILRPEPGASRTARAAETMGLVPITAPLFRITSMDWAMPDTRPDALLLTSANAARRGGPQLARWHHLPVYAVGQATAAAARAVGFGHVIAGDRDAAAIATRAAADGVRTMLHLAGREHRPVGHPAIRIDRRIVYASDALETLPDAARAALPGAVALLHSPRAAALFAALVDPTSLAIAAISPTTRAAAGDGWAATAIADAPTDASLLAAAAKLCNQEG